MSGDTLGSFGGTGFDGTSYNGFATGRIVVLASEDWTTTAHGTRMLFETAPNGTINQANFQMLLDQNGNLGIGTTTPADVLDVDGDIRMGTTGTNGCLRNNNGGIVIGTCSSDLRFKRDITPFAPSLDRVAALRPVHYFWRAEAYPEKHFGSDRAYGLIAQEVEEILPELVTTDADGYQAVDYAKLPLLAIQAIKELKEENEALLAGQAELERRLAALELLLTTRQ
jgi:hypothetical protein